MDKRKRLTRVAIPPLCAEGHELSCSNIKILNNQIGPCGHAPNDGHQFKRQVGGVISPGQWADGENTVCICSENRTDTTHRS